MLQDRLIARMLLSIIGLVQVFDIFVHVALNQAEPLRIIGNIVVLLLLASLAFRSGASKTNFRQIALGAVISYLVLNGIFLAIHGVTNQGNPRTVMFLLVGVTTVLSLFYTFAFNPNNSYDNSNTRNGNI